MSRWWSLHTHSRRSKDDAMSPVSELVSRAAELGYPALGLTDHGDMGGVAELYTAASKAGIKPLPGVELYLTTDHGMALKRNMHLTVVAYTPVGYRNLVGLNNTAMRSFFTRPRVDFADLARFGERDQLLGLAIGTGCRSGPVVKALTERGPRAAEQVCLALASWFPRVYVELMDHGFKADGMWDHEITAELVGIAERLGLPTIITSDTHYTYETDRDAHDALKTLVVHQGVEIDERKFNGSGYWLVDEAHLHEVYAPKVIEAALQSLAELADKACVTIPELDTFSLKIPDVTFKGTQQATLEERASTALVAWLDGKPASWGKRYEERLLAELDVVQSSGFAGYLLLVVAITDYCTERGIWFHTRGSATGSLILYVLGVTQEDPVAWDIRFDRFLSPDRSSPPDVDLDIEHGRRDEVVGHFSERYPALQVGTTMTYGITQEENEDGEQGGSLAVKYYSVQRQLGTGVNSWADIPEQDKATLLDLAERGLVSGKGAHPGGYVFAADQASIDFMPLSYIASSKTLVTAWDKGDVERAGLPKIDLLGSKVLTALRICCDLIAAGDGRDYYRAIPMEDKESLARCAKGNTVGLFQLGGWTNRKVCEQIGPKRVKDLVAVQALARPAPMQSGFTKSFLRRRDKAEAIPVMHDDIAAETKDTYGLAIYQEQLVGVLRRLGLDAMRLTKLLKAVKASGKAHAIEAAAVMDSELESLITLAQDRGWQRADIDWLSGCLRDYGAGYSFGKAHSVQYGVTGYRTAYLATHEPLAYWTGMLIAYTGSKDAKTKEPLELRYKTQARKDGVKVLPPHVLYSSLEYAPDPENYAIREGFNSVPYLTEKAATELMAQRPFATVMDIAKRCSNVSGAKDVMFMDATAFEEWATITDPEGVPLRKSAMATLYRAGALKGLEYGDPMRKATGRIRKCKDCKITFPTPLEYEDHHKETHGSDA